MKLALLVTCVSLAFGQIPVKRVVLYKNGVGYFDHRGPVQGKQDVTVSFTSGQFNDVLKSLTVLDLNGGSIAAIGYDASLPSDRKLNELRLPVGDKGTLTDFLGAMRGARIEVRNGGVPLTGRLVSAERKTRSGAGATLEVDYVSLLTEAGELRTAEVSPAFSVRLLDPGLATKLGKYLDVLSAGRAAVNETRTYTIRNNDAAPRALLLEHPVRSGYRLTNSVEPAETTGAVMRFRVPVPARQTAAFPVAETRSLASTYTIGALIPSEVARFAAEGSLGPAVENALRQILTNKAVLDRLSRQSKTIAAEHDRITKSQERLRENMKALKGSPEEKSLVQRYTRQLEEQETRIAELEKQDAELEAKIDKLRFDVTL